MTGPARGREAWTDVRRWVPGGGRLVAVALVAAASLAAAGPRADGPPLTELACAIQVEALLDAWRGEGPWFEDAAGPRGGRRWRRATDRVGVWVTLEVDARGAPTLSRVTSSATEQTTFDGGCRPAHARSAGAPSPRGAFDDAELAALLRDDRSGVIYVWSPHMPLSVDGFAQVARACADLGIALTPLLDPGADPGYARAAAREAGLPPAAVRPFHSVELVFRNATLHAPSILVRDRGRLVGLAVPGYRDAAGYRAVIETRLAAAAPAPGGR